MPKLSVTESAWIGRINQELIEKGLELRIKRIYRRNSIWTCITNPGRDAKRVSNELKNCRALTAFTSSPSAKRNAA